MTDGIIGDLPSGYPPQLSGPLAWTGPDFEGRPDLYCTFLSEQDIPHIGAALQYFKKLNLARGFASPKTFPLPNGLAERLRAITDVVYSTSGFQILRGLDVSRYDEEERAILYVGMSSYVADLRARNIDHIRDKTKDAPPHEILKPPELTVPMTFHTDIGVRDMLTMFTQSAPLQGGDQYLASMTSIYNILAAEDPTVLKTLSEN